MAVFSTVIITAFSSHVYMLGSLFGFTYELLRLTMIVSSQSMLLINYFISHSGGTINS